MRHLLCILAATLLLCACQREQTQETSNGSSTPLLPGEWFKGGPGVGERPVIRGAWHPQVTQIRLLPTSRFVLEQGEPILDVSVELLDQMEDSIKASGHLRFELFERDPGVVPVRGRRLYVWDVRLMTLDDQRAYFNPIVGGYTFRLAVDDTEIGRVPTLLQVSLQLADGNRLQNQMEIESGR